MGIDFPTALAIAAAAALCIFAAALAYDPGGTADPAPLAGPSVKDGEILRALDETVKMYRNGGQDAKAGEQEEMFQNKAAEVASRLLDVEVSSVYADLFFPGPLDPTRHPGQICGSAGDIPVHLAKVRDVERYGMFMEKYSAYPIEMHLNDERPFGFHYGFVATSGDGRYASTFFHVDPCTGVVTDSAGYLLTCHDEESDYFFSTTNQDDINASLKLGDFCVIPIGQWRQSLYDYAKEVSERSHRHFVGEGPVDNYDDYVAFWHEGERLDALTGLAYAVASDNFADDIIQEKIQEYRDAYGALPDEFLKLLEDRDDG